MARLGADGTGAAGLGRVFTCVPKASKACASGLAHQDTPSHTRFADGPILNETLISWFFAQYIDAQDRSDWRFAPLLADDLAGVAPAWVGLAEVDPLVDEGVAYADQLRMAGVPVDLEIYRGVTHAMMTMSRAIPEARQALQDAANALRQAFEVA